MSITLDLPPDVAGRLAAHALRLGTTPELLALQGVLRVLPVVDPPPALPGETMLDYLKDYIGSVDGSGEAYSQDCGKRFADGLDADRRASP